MSDLAAKYATSRQLFTQGVKRTNSFAFQWRDLVAPWHGYCPRGMTWERVFVVLDHLVDKASDYECPHPDGWGRSTPFDKLNATSAHGTSSFYPLGEQWKEELFNRFRHLLLGWPCSQAQSNFATDLGFWDINNPYIIRQRTYKPGYQPINDALVQSLISGLLQVKGKTRKRHNNCHPRAVHTTFKAVVLGSESERVCSSSTAIGATAAHGESPLLCEKRRN